MKCLNWKKLIGVGLSVFTLFVGSVGLTSCDQGGEEFEQEEGLGEQGGEEFEQEEGLGEQGEEN